MFQIPMNQKHKLKFMLDYGGGFLWPADDEAEQKFADIGLSENTIQLSEYVSELYYLRLNPVYQMLPSFWSGEMRLLFQQKLIELYDKIIAEVGREFEIMVDELCAQEMNERIDVTQINRDLQEFLNDPVDYFLVNHIHFNDEESLIHEIRSEYEKWRNNERKYLLLKL